MKQDTSSSAPHKHIQGKTLRLRAQDLLTAAVKPMEEGYIDVSTTWDAYLQAKEAVRRRPPFRHNMEMGDNDLEFAFDLDVKAQVRTIRVMLPQMLERRDGAIINMATVASSVKGVPNRAAYSISKAVVIGLTKSVAADYVASKIRVNAICPGTVESPSLHERWHATADFEAARNAFIARRPIGGLGALTKWLT